MWYLFSSLMQLFLSSTDILKLIDSEHEHQSRPDVGRRIPGDMRMFNVCLKLKRTSERIYKETFVPYGCNPPIFM